MAEWVIAAVCVGIVLYHLEGRARSWAELEKLGVGGFFRQAFQRGPFETLVHIGVTSIWILPVIAAGPLARLVYLLFSTALSLVLWHPDFYKSAVTMAGLDHEHIRQVLPILPYYPWVMTRPGIDGGPLGSGSDSAAAFGAAGLGAGLGVGLGAGFSADSAGSLDVAAEDAASGVVSGAFTRQSLRTRPVATGAHPANIAALQSMQPTDVTEWQRPTARNSSRSHPGRCIR